MKEIPSRAAKRLYRELNESVLETSKRTNQIASITEADLQQRLFTFWSERPDRCERLFDELTKTLGEFLPQARMHRIHREMKAIKEDNVKKYLDLIERYEKNLTDLEAKDAQRSQLEILKKK